MTRVFVLKAIVFTSWPSNSLLEVTHQNEETVCSQVIASFILSVIPQILIKHLHKENTVLVHD